MIYCRGSDLGRVWNLDDAEIDRNQGLSWSAIFGKIWDFSDAKIDGIWGLSWSLLEQVNEVLGLQLSWKHSKSR